MALNYVPLSGQTLGVTRVPINQNFSVIDTAFAVDHVDYNVSGQGQHNKVSFPVQNPAPAPQAGVLQLYSQLSTITNQPELVFTHQTGSTAPVAARIVEFTSAGWANPGWCRLPSGILMKWGTINTTTYNTLETIPFSVGAGIPVFSAIYSCQITTASAQTDTQVVVIMGSFTTTTVNVIARKLIGFGGATSFTFFAIGI